jgi:hypothetical protein
MTTTIAGQCTGTLFCLPDGVRSSHINPETAVGREKDVQDIDVHGEFEKRVVTLLVISAFSNFPGASRACADFRDPTAVSGFNQYYAYRRQFRQ